MMIGPGGYVAENIEGKTREEALDEIESLWEEIIEVEYGSFQICRR